MEKLNLIKTFAVQALSGSTATCYVGDISFKDSTVTVYSAAASGTFDVQKSVDGNVWTAIAARQVTGTGAAVAVSLSISPASGSANYIRLSNVAANPVAMTGPLTGTISGPPNP